MSEYSDWEALKAKLFAQNSNLVSSNIVTESRHVNTTAPVTGGGDLSADRTIAVSDMVGDSGAGGTRGTVPAPPAGSAAAGKFLKADGTFAVPAGSGVTSVGATAPITSTGGTTPTISANYHGNSTKIQLSDNTGTSGNFAKYDASGNLTDGAVPPATKTAVAGSPLLSYDATAGTFTQGTLTASQVGALPSTTVLAATKTAVAGSPLLSYDSTTGTFTQGALTAAQVSALPASTVLAATKTAVAGSPLLSYDATTGAFTQGALTAAQVSALPSSTVLPVTKAAVASNFLTSYTSGTGAFTAAQPASSDLSDSANVALYNSTTAFTVTQTHTKAGISGTPTDALVLNNTTASTGGATKQLAPNLHWQGHVWNTTATAADNQSDWIIFPNTTSGTTPTHELSFRQYIGVVTGSPTYTEDFKITQTGISIPTGNTYQINGTQISAANLSNGTTGTAGTNVVLATSPALAGTATVAALTSSGTVTFNSQANKLGENSISAASGAINSTETVVVQTTSAVGANRLVAGTTIRVRLYGTCTSTVANVSTFGIRIGTAGTTSDTLVATLATSVAATSGTNIPFDVEIYLTVRTVGASGTAIAYMDLDNQGSTGIIATTFQLVKGTMAAFDTTANNFISATYKSAASTTTSTFDIATIEVVYK